MPAGHPPAKKQGCESNQARPEVRGQLEPGVRATRDADEKGRGGDGSLLFPEIQGAPRLGDAHVCGGHEPGGARHAPCRICTPGFTDEREKVGPAVAAVSYVQPPTAQARSFFGRKGGCLTRCPAGCPSSSKCFRTPGVSQIDFGKQLSPYKVKHGHRPWRR